MHCEHSHSHNHSHCGHSHSHSCAHHGCSHEHGESNTKLLTARLLIGAGLSAIGVFLADTVGIWLFAAAVIILGLDVIISAVKSVFRLRLDERFLMSIAAFGAFILGEHLEAAAVMFFYQLGEFMSDKAADKTRNSIAALLDIRPDTARVIKDGTVVTISCEEIEIGDRIIAGAGERIAIDGRVAAGTAYLDTSSVTGEHLPRLATEGDRVLSGMIPADSTIEIIAEKEFCDSTLSRILELTQEAQDKKSGAERFITSFAMVYTPIVTVLALLIALLPPLFALGSFSVWIYRALSFLVISCPCALLVSVPLTFFAGIGALSRHGVLVKSALAIESLAHSKTIAFDKTGTLTKGTPTLTEIRVNGSKAELLELAAYAEADSAHPIAAAIKNAYGKEIDRNRIKQITELTSRGVCAVIDGKEILTGSRLLMEERDISLPENTPPSAVIVAVDSVYLGYIGIGDSLKSDSAKAVSELRGLGLDVVMLTGDKTESALKAANATGIDSVYAELLPEDKTTHIERLKENGGVIFAGDGINDSPSLASASVGIAMGAAGADSAVEAADAVIMSDKPIFIAQAIKHSRRFMAIAKQNIYISIGIKFAVMFVASSGIGGMWPAIFADVGLCVITVLNALRAFSVKSADKVGKKY